MSLTSPVPCVSNDILFIVFLDFNFFCICCHRKNHIRLKMSLTMMVLTQDPLVHTLLLIFLRFYCSVGHVSGLGSGIFVPTGVDSKCEILRLSYLYQYKSTPTVVNSLNHFGAKITCSLSKFVTQFYTYSHGMTSPHSFLPPSLHQKHDPERSNGHHPYSFVLWQQG